MEVWWNCSSLPEARQKGLGLVIPINLALPTLCLELFNFHLIFKIQLPLPLPHQLFLMDCQSHGARVHLLKKNSR